MKTFVIEMEDGGVMKGELYKDMAPRTSATFEKLPKEIEQYYSGKSIMIVFPDQLGDRSDTMTFAEPQHQEEKSAYQSILDWIKRRKP